MAYIQNETGKMKSGLLEVRSNSVTWASVFFLRSILMSGLKKMSGAFGTLVRLKIKNNICILLTSEF